MLYMNRFVRQENSTPDINADRCVHSYVETAKCQACVDACPRGAWSLEDHALVIDESNCDGCGLCSGACPEEAIRFDIGPKLEERGGRLIAFIGCDIALSPGTGVIPCVHALSTRDLLSLYRNGVRELIVCIADCDHCPRGRGQRLNQLLFNVNAMITSRKLQSIQYGEIESGAWVYTKPEPAKQATDPKINRRSFLKSVFTHASMEFASLHEEATGTDDQTPVNLLLPVHSQSDVLARAPTIDPSLCSGCDACARLCPHDAVTIEEANDSLEYRIHALQCSGCGICVDVCDQQAVSIQLWSKQKRQSIPLTTSRCHACGSPFHEPLVRHNRRLRDLCPVCRQTNHPKNLFQVFN